ncbi:TrxA protein [Actinobacillus seminis]|uniref:Thiol:disulfide interchange protein DsbA n=1 Tax=Actinobacillus seminis TaxID=722 RepID=A0A380VA06_9PAST|nr:TrxA protein [Actinobacillus seminis]
MWKRCFLLGMLVFSSLALAETSGSTANSAQLPAKIGGFEDGKDYFSYSEQQHIPYRSDKKILIQFFFDYDCRVCSTALDILTLYSQINADKVVLNEIPVATKKTSLSATIFFTFNAMQAENASEALLFETSEKQRYIKLMDFNQLTQWVSEQHLNVEQFIQLFHSDSVKNQVNYAIELTEEYGVFTFPYVIIDGRYVLTASTLYSDDYSFAVLDFLLNKLQQEKK